MEERKEKRQINTQKKDREREKTHRQVKGGRDRQTEKQLT